MEEMVNLQIDGKQVKARPGATVLEAAREAGMKIPTLCVHEKLAPYGACRICSVEAEKGGRVKVVASCGYPVEEGLVIRTTSPRLKKIRKLVLELVGPQATFEGQVGGELRKIADENGADIHRFEARLAVKSQRCILCGLCVRYCDEVIGSPAIGFVGRGIERRVVFYPDKARKVFAGGMEWATEVCPTGKIGAESDGTYFGFTIDDFLAGKL
jgi:bidirectional [NiFe] hydrogenase diaphorase subunit